MCVYAVVVVMFVFSNPLTWQLVGADISSILIGAVNLLSCFESLCSRKLGLDLVVRDDEGNVLDPMRSSTIRLFRLVCSTCITALCLYLILLSMFIRIQFSLIFRSGFLLSDYMARTH